MPNLAMTTGKSTLGVHGEASLRRLLAMRLYREKAQSTRFPLRYSLATKHTTGKAYITVPIDVEGLGLRNFIIDTGMGRAMETCNSELSCANRFENVCPTWVLGTRSRASHCPWFA
jgi:hypothetical protein